MTVHAALIYDGGSRGPFFRVTDGTAQIRVTLSGTAHQALIQLDDGELRTLTLSLPVTVCPGDLLTLAVQYEALPQLPVFEAPVFTEEQRRATVDELAGIAEMLRRHDVA